MPPQTQLHFHSSPSQCSSSYRGGLIEIFLLLQLLKLVDAVVQAGDQTGIFEVHPQSVVTDKAMCHEGSFLPCPAAGPAADIDALQGIDALVILRDLEADCASGSSFSQVIGLVGRDTSEVFLIFNSSFFSLLQDLHCLRRAPGGAVSDAVHYFAGADAHVPGLSLCEF